MHLQLGGEGVDFLGFHHRLVRSQGRRGSGKGIVFLARWPTNKAMQHARDRIRELTDRRRLLLSNQWIVEGINSPVSASTPTWWATVLFGRFTVAVSSLMVAVRSNTRSSSVDRSESAMARSCSGDEAVTTCWSPLRNTPGRPLTIH